MPPCLLLAPLLASSLRVLARSLSDMPRDGLQTATQRTLGKERPKEPKSNQHVPCVARTAIGLGTQEHGEQDKKMASEALKLLDCVLFAMASCDKGWPPQGLESCVEGFQGCPRALGTTHSSGELHMG